MKVLERQERIEAAGGTAVFVVFDEAEAVGAAMLRGIESPYPVLVDVERRSYREWGLRRASFARVYLDWRVWRDYARMLLGGERPGRPGRDTLQLGGDFVIDRGGTVAYARPQQADDRPPVGELVRALEDVAPRRP